MTPAAGRGWANVLIAVGGLLMALLWIRFITLHGPTSFNEDGRWLGQDPLFWGAMMSAPPSLLIALGLWGHRALLTRRAGRAARIGYALVLVGLVVPALVDLALVALGPPLLLPLVAVGLLLLGVHHRRNPALPGTARVVLPGLGLLLLAAFGFMIGVPPATFDRIDGYRLFGLAAHLAFGFGWITFAASLARASRFRASVIDAQNAV
ncbi:MAG: hypothetical protein H0T13_07285 [Actinobacteria bacterium]|nr:hypothetical protein [Actinomycetota bacterium]